MTDNEMLGYEGNHPDGVRAICKECETVTLEESESEALEVAEDHNKDCHDGEDVAGVCAWDIDPLIHEDQSPEQKLKAILVLEETINDDDLTNEEKRRLLGMSEP